MSKSRTKLKRTIISSSTGTLVGIADEHDSTVCCSNRNCPSHWHNRLTEKLRHIQQSKLKTSCRIAPIKPSKHCYKLSYSDILSKLFQINESDENNHEIYSRPIEKSIILNKHELFIQQISKTYNNLASIFVKNNLTLQMKYRMIPLVSDSFSEQMDRMETSKQLKINLLRLNYIHLNCRLPVKIISIPIWNYLAVHVIVQDENSDCLRLSIYNWPHIIDTRQIKTYDEIQTRLTNLLPMNSCIVLLDPWLKKCQDGDIALRCESPSTHLLLIDFEARCSKNDKINVEQLRQIGNSCYQIGDNLAAIEFYTFALRQLDEQQEKELTLKGQSMSRKTDEYEQHRIRLLSNRCACYLRERHASLALADTGFLLKLHELSHFLESPTAAIKKLSYRYLTAHLYLELYDQVESLLKSHKFDIALCEIENVSSMSTLEQDLNRLKNEARKGQYDLQGMLDEQINSKSHMMFIDLTHHHAKYHRSDIFEIRLCQIDELKKNGYPHDSYGVYALKDIEPGTLLVVEQPFASIDNRVIREEYCHSINYWRKKSKIEYCTNDSLRLLNEIEKQLLIGASTWITFDKIKLMQPIRQWLAKIMNENIGEQRDHDDTVSDLVENYEQILSEKKQWNIPSPNQLSTPSPFIPWRILFETQQQNPFRSQSTYGWYQVGSMFNHSCLPNCLWYLIGDYLFIYVCSSNVRQGDELTISYCPLWISSINERTKQLRQYGIKSCQCLLCLYDRSVRNEYENELSKFAYFRALARQKNISNIDRFDHLKQLKCYFDSLTKKCHKRPVGFINEFIDLEYVLSYFQEDDDDTDIKEFINSLQNSFLERLSNVCHFTLPDISNPSLLFGIHIQLLIDHIERFYTSDLQQWSRLFEYLYEIYTFKCHSLSTDVQKTFQDHKKLFSNLFQTQSFFNVRL